MTDQERIEATERLHQLVSDMAHQSKLVESARERVDAPEGSLMSIRAVRIDNRILLKSRIDEYRKLRSVYFSELKKLIEKEGITCDLTAFGIVGNEITPH